MWLVLVSLENISSFEQSIMSNVEKRENLLPPLGNEWQSVKVDSTQLQTSSDLDRRGGKDLRGQHADSITHRSSSTDIGRNSYNTSQQDADRHYTRTITKEADVKSELRDPEPGEIYDEKDAFSTHRTSHFVSERDSERDYRNRCDDASYESIDRKLNQKDNRDTKTRSNRQPDKDRNTSRSPENRSRSLERRQDDFMSGKLKGSPVKGPVSPPRSRGSPSQTPERSLFDDEAEPGKMVYSFKFALYFIALFSSLFLCNNFELCHFAISVITFVNHKVEHLFTLIKFKNQNLKRLNYTLFTLSVAMLICFLSKRRIIMNRLNKNFLWSNKLDSLYDWRILL